MKKLKRKIKKFNCSPKLDKDVVIPTRSDVLPILEELREELVNKFMLPEEFVEKLGIFVGRRFNVNVKHAESAQVDHNDVDFNAYYDGGLDEADEVPIEIYMITNPIQDIIVVDNPTFDSIIRRISDSLAHEVIHMQQYRSRDFLEVGNYAPDDMDEEEENQFYLSDPDEINAYAHNIANELLEHGNIEVCKQKLNNLKNITLKDSINLWAYLATFSKDANHPVIRRLLKKVYINLTELEKRT